MIRTPSIRFPLLAAGALLSASLLFLAWHGAAAGLVFGVLATGAVVGAGSYVGPRGWRHLMLASALVILAAGHWLVPGQDRLSMTLSMLVMGLLPALRRTAIVAVAGSVLVGLAAWQAWTHGWPVAMQGPVVVLALQVAMLCWYTPIIVSREEMIGEVRFLIRAMGAEGPIRLNLDVVRSESSLATRLRQVQDRMREALVEARRLALGVQGAAQEIGSGGNALTERTQRGATGLREAAMTLEQISVIVKSSAEAALEARTTAELASTQAEQGAQLFVQLIDKMHAIDAASREIGDIVGVIDGIAFQTNILALNAAVEAARAGEQGRGFAVVAGEVRSLALRASASAGQIKALIQRSGETVREGNRLADEAGQAVNGIVESVRNVGQVFATLSADTTEHAGSIGSVTDNVRELDQLTCHNVGMAEALGRIAEALGRQGRELDVALGAFHLGHDEVAAEPVEPAQPARRAELPAAPPAPAPAPASAVEFF